MYLEFASNTSSLISARTSTPRSLMLMASEESAAVVAYLSACGECLYRLSLEVSRLSLRTAVLLV